MRFHSARHQVACDDASHFSIDDDQLEHFGTREHLYFARRCLPQQRLISEQKLLAGLAPGVERSRNLRASERTVRKGATVLSREGHTLRDALIDDVQAELRKPVYVRFTAAEITSFDGVVEEPINAVAVVLIILRCVD